MSKELPLYFDYMASTPVDPRVADVMMDCLKSDRLFGNPSSTTHVYGRNAAKAIDTARERFAQTIGAEPRNIVFTSGATEANNLAIIGAAEFYQHVGKHIITVCTEHKTVLDSVAQLKKNGFSVTILPVQANGLLDMQTLENALTAETTLVSVMHVNNEIGVIQDIVRIGQLLRERGILFHVDAAQSAGKLPINLAQLPVNLMSFSAHKLYGPKGIGALYVAHKPRVRLSPRTFGGGHEGGIRSGTLATHQILGMAEAFVIAESCREAEQQYILALRKKLWQGIADLPQVHLNGDVAQRVAGNLNVTFTGFDGESLLLAMHRLAISSTSACLAASHQPSYVLKALGLDDEAAMQSFRISLGRYTKEADVIEAIRVIKTAVLGENS